MIIKGKTYGLRPVTTKTYSQIVKLLKEAGIKYDLSNTEESNVDMLALILEKNLLPAIVNIIYVGENNTNPNLEEIEEADLETVISEVVAFFLGRVQLLTSILLNLQKSTQNSNEPVTNTET